MSKKKKIAIVLIIVGIAIAAVPVFRLWYGWYQRGKMTEEFIHTIVSEKEDKADGGKSEKESKTAINREDAEFLSQGDVIGIIEIESIGIKYPIKEGATSSELAYAIGHISDTAMIGAVGNCVLAGHRGGRYGEFFRYLNRVEIGDGVKITDKQGGVHNYEIVKSFVVEPYDNTVKTQGEEEVLTLLTCENNGTMRLILVCEPVSDNNN